MIKNFVLLVLLFAMTAFSQAQYNSSHTIVHIFGLNNDGGAMATRTESMLVFPRRPDKTKPVGVYDGDLNFIAFIRITDVNKDEMYFCSVNNQRSMIQWFKRYNFIWFTTEDIYGDKMTFKLDLSGFTRHFNGLR